MVEAIVDMKELNDRLMDDHELILELMGDFEKDFSKNRKALGKAIQAQDFEQIKDIAHHVKGAAGNLSIKPMHVCGMLIEQMAIEKKIELMDELLTDWDNQFAEFQQFFKRLKEKGFN